MTTGRINQVAVRTEKRVCPFASPQTGPEFNVGKLGSDIVAWDGGPGVNWQTFPSVFVFSGFCTEKRSHGQWSRTLSLDCHTYRAKPKLSYCICSLSLQRAGCETTSHTSVFEMCIQLITGFLPRVRYPTKILKSANIWTFLLGLCMHYNKAIASLHTCAQTEFYIFMYFP